MGADVLRARISEGPEQAALWVRAAALNGLINAQLAWGQMLVDGHGVPRDPTAGLRWFRIAAEAGSAEGRNMVGRCHELGWGVEADAGEAARHYREAAGKGEPWAQFNLARLLLEGNGVPPDRREALHWYARAARAGHVKSATLVGRYLEHGWDRPPRPAAALRWYRRGAEGGDYRGQFDYARLLLERTGRLDLAQPWFERSVEAGVPLFCREVGEGLRHAPHAELRKIALRALERACATGKAGDLRRYASALSEGLGGQPDPEAARIAFTDARALEISDPTTGHAAARHHSRIYRVRRIGGAIRWLKRFYRTIKLG
ncbi:sel1 repeat family protein [Ancylobacter sp. MQZ15Z-1]|uniref:Sel1 repeat family protein n=1 Tax=Ancylobacter mangrovi TaxID=2972472 RepID=A0A9X2P7W5_9HYPH|nr:tetratricopeptide repeat protein [Ancylobacter mangrovi]MCS0493739.1 sel1 repeat family protein [Ancylobacter mangrovi]